MHRVVISAAREQLGYSVDDLLDLCSHRRPLTVQDRIGCQCRLRRAQAHRRCTPNANLNDPHSLATSGFAIPSDTTPFSSKAPKPGQVTSR